ncbi:Hypothetical predicted protein [Paramuricea clavata]|uniref:Uncharacterized protein n=1 Tax=Paramuricea clavata TaxID=317549 RepID=A0A6S7FZU6_PARCT|nr:Hypothetical predicted protein [Paramuricea clavata]
MVKAMLDKLIEAVKSLKDGSDSQSETNTNVNQTSTEDAIDCLFPSIGTSRGSIASSRQKDGNALSLFNSNVNYAPKRRKRNGPSTSSSTSSCTAAKKKTPERKAGAQPNYNFVRAIGNKIVRVNNGPYTGKLLKHISNQGPVYIRSVIDVSGEDLKGWLGDKFEDESNDDESIMNPVFAMNDKRKVAASTTLQPQVPVEVR